MLQRRLVPAAALVLLMGCAAGYRETASVGDLRVHRGTFIKDVVLTGELEAAQGEIIVVPPLPSWQTTIKWLAPEGAEVRQGDRVVELDNTSFTSDLDQKKQGETQARQQLQQSEAQWAADVLQKQLELERNKSELEKARLDAAVPREIFSMREYEERQTRLSRATVAWQKARDLLSSQQRGNRADRSNLELTLGRTRREIQTAQHAIDTLILRAPRDGIVVIKDLPWEARKLQAGDGVWVGFPLALLPELSSLQVSASLADVDDGRIASGMPASVTLDGYPALNFKGQVVTVSAVAQESARQSLRRAFKVVVRLDRIDLERMRPGLSARVSVRSEARNDVLLVSRAALDMTSSAPRARLDNGKHVPVTIGSCNAQDCVVLDGLDENQSLRPIEQVDRRG